VISNGNCGGTISQQGSSGQDSTPTTVQNANPTIEVQRATTTTQSPGVGLTPVQSCLNCFPFQSLEWASHVGAFLTALQNDKVLTQLNHGPFTSFEDICQLFLSLTNATDQTNAINAIQNDLTTAGFSTLTVESIVGCLQVMLPAPTSSINPMESKTPH
jgi:hypothetical protein